MEAIILCGIQATGKSTFCKERLFDSHVRINLDMLKTRHRQNALLLACIDAKQPFVLDSTNATRAERQPFIAAARAAGFRVVGYYFESRVADAVARNAGRTDEQRIPDRGIKGTSVRLQLPQRDEGFDSLFYVRIGEPGRDGGDLSFDVQEWRDEV